MSTKLWTLSLERSECIGEYKSGGLYNSSDKLIGKFDGKYVYVGINEVVAEIEKGKIYPVESDFLYGVRVTTSIVGEATMGYVYSKSVEMAEYTGDADEAAALAAVLLFGMNDGWPLSDIEKDKTKKTHMREKHRETSSDEDSGSGVGCIMLLIYFVIGFFILACAIVAVMVSVPTFLGVWLLSLLIKFIIRCCKENPEPETEEEKRKFFSIVLWISMILSVGITITGFCTTSRTEEILAGILSCGVEIGVFGWAISSVSKGKWKKLFKSSAKKSAPSSKTAKKVAGDISSKSGSVSATKTATTDTTTGTKTSVTGSTTGTKTSTSAGHSRVRTTINKKEENPKKGIGEDTKSYVSGGTDSSKKVTGKDSVSTTTVSRVHKNIKFKETSGSESTITKTPITDNPYFKTPGDL